MCEYDPLTTFSVPYVLKIRDNLFVQSSTLLSQENFSERPKVKVFLSTVFTFRTYTSLKLDGLIFN